MTNNLANPGSSLRQASVFQDATENFNDPSDEAGYWWVTVTLPERMSRSPPTDEQIMCYVHDSIALEEMMGIRHVQISERALHGQGKRCISLPVRGMGQSQQDVMAQAVTLATWWLAQIRGRRVKLDQFMIFEAQEGFLGDCRDVPLDWKKPFFAGPDSRRC